MDFPLEGRPGVALDPGYLKLLRADPLIPVNLPGARAALLVTQHADVSRVLSDSRFSRAAWHNGTLFARRSEALALVTSDAPTHTRRRKAVQAWFTNRRAASARPAIERLAEHLISGLEQTGPGADLVAGFTLPLAYGVICDMLAVPVDDMPVLLPWVTAMMSAGRCPASEVAAAHDSMYGYFEGQLAERRRAIAAGAPGDDIITALLTAAELSDEEITVLGFGLLMAGGETTTNFLSCCILEILSRPALAQRLRLDSSLIPGAVEECLRWVWFGGTGGQPHVVLEDVELAGTRLRRGQVVIPMTDAANRDPEVFEDADVFRPGRTPNPHVGFGHGRHMCLGAAHARVEAEVGVRTLLLRLPDLAVAGELGNLDWRDKMFIRGVWSLPITWRPR
jgi:cytochrome P450